MIKNQSYPYELSCSSRIELYIFSTPEISNWLKISQPWDCWNTRNFF